MRGSIIRRGLNVTIYTTPNLTGEVLPGQVSDALDHARPSRRLCLHDGPRETSTRRYAAILLPFSASAPTPAVAALRLEVVGARITCAFTLAGRSYVLAWGEDTLESIID